jgi:tetratricopeptide (TPR) repeat protein
MQHIRFLFAVVFAAWLGLTVPSSAQSDHVAHYKAYSEALNRGDPIAAVEHAEAAWRAAETELGDNQTTAILAYNFANQIYYPRPADAIAPLKRVIELTGESSELFGAEEPGIMLLYVEARTDDKPREKNNALRRILTDRETTNSPQNLLAARAWIYLFTVDIQKKRYRRAQQSAAYAIRHYKQYQSSLTHEAAQAYIAEGIARVAGPTRNAGDLREAVELFNQAIELFPPQLNIESFDPLLATSVAWQLIAHAANTTDNPGRPKLGSRIPRNPSNLASIAKVKWVTPQPDPHECEFDWEKHKIPTFPDSALIKGYLGGVLIGYHIDGKQVVGARILAEVPRQSEFGEVTLEAVKTWELAAEPSVDCRSNILTSVRFSIR